MNNIRYLVVHCSATPASRDIGVREIRQMHLQRGFRDVGFKVERDDETGDETGFLTFTASMKAQGVTKEGRRWTQKPSIFDAQGNKLVNPPMIGGGTEGKLSVEIEPFINQTSKTVEMSRRLLAAQVLKLVTGGSRSFSDYGFAAEDGDVIEDQAPFGDETAGETTSTGGRDDDL